MQTIITKDIKEISKQLTSIYNGLGNIADLYSELSDKEKETLGNLLPFGENYLAPICTDLRRANDVMAGCLEHI